MPSQTITAALSLTRLCAGFYSARVGIYGETSIVRVRRGRWVARSNAGVRLAVEPSLDGLLRILYALAD